MTAAGVTVEIPGAAQERLIPVVVVGLQVFELPVEAAVQAGRQFGKGPTGKRPGAFPHVVFRIVANSHAKELQQLTAPVFVHRIGVVLVVVQPVDHGRVFSYRHQKISIVAQSVFPEHVNLGVHDVVVVYFRLPGCENLVPQEDHFLFQRALGGNHGVQPVGAAHSRQSYRPGKLRVQPQKFVPVIRLFSGVHEVFDRGLISPRGPGFQFFPARAKTGAAHQMRHQRNILIGHLIPLSE